MGACLISSVENGVVICSLSKDYELSSWNEQGEILQKEGMLTICFSYIFLCSHIDRKELYLIMKIPYLVNMPQDYEAIFRKKLKSEKGRLELFDVLIPSLLQKYEIEKRNRIALETKINNFESKLQEADLKDMDFGLGKGLIPINFDKYIEWMEEVPKLKKRINKLENNLKDYEKIKNEIIGLKELFSKSTSGWEIKGDNVAVGLDPFTNEIKQYGFPKNFNEKKADDLHYTDDNFYMCSFKYYFRDSHPWPDGPFKKYDMPMTLYDYLCSRTEIDMGTTKEIKQIPKKKMQKQFKTPELLLQYFRENLGKEYYSYSLISIIVPFIFENNKKAFTRKDASIYCETKRGKKPVDATIHKHFNLLINHGIIDRKYHGVYEVIERSINFD